MKDIDLPVCKIGMTTRSPTIRCNEINKSSTGDFIWQVAYSYSVNDCAALENLVHRQLFPLRQKGREFFNIKVDKANKAVLSIIENKNEFFLMGTNRIVVQKEPPPSLPKTKNKNYPQPNAINFQYVELLQSFNTILGVNGAPLVS